MFNGKWFKSINTIVNNVIIKNKIYKDVILMKDNKIWNKRYNSSKWGLERPISFQYFQIYLHMEKPRSIKKLHELINKSRVSENKSKIKIDTLYNYSHKWNWKERIEAYDNHIKRLVYEKNKRKLIKWETEQLDKAMGRVDIINNEFERIKSDDSLNIIEEINIALKNQTTYGKAIDDVFKIVNKGVLQISNNTTLNSNINQCNYPNNKKTLEELDKEYEERFKEFVKSMEAEKEQDKY